MNKQQEPCLRFKGFMETWECRKLGDVVEIVGGYAFKSAEFGSGNMAIIRISNILPNGSIGGDFVYFGEDENLEKFKANKNDYLIAMSGATTGKIGQVRHEAYINQRVGLFRQNENSNNNFIGSLLQKEEFLTYLMENWGAGAQPNISIKQMENYNTYFPNLKEQTAIGNFFRRLDSQIAESRAVLEKSRQLKKAMLAKMFPANGEKIPKIRFKGFEGEWEEKKLGDVVQRITRKNTNLDSLLPLTISAQNGLIAQTEFFDNQVAGKNLTGYYLIENGEFAYNKSYSNGYPWGAIKRLDRYKNGVLSTLYILFKPTFASSQYLVSYFDGTNWHGEVASIAGEGARNHGLLNIPVHDFFEIKILLPCSLQEQTAIGNFFRQLDEIIALQSAEVEKLNQLKKGLLAAMLV